MISTGFLPLLLALPAGSLQEEDPSYRINDPLPDGVFGEVESDYAFSPDGRWVVYRADARFAGVM